MKKILFYFLLMLSNPIYALDIETAILVPSCIDWSDNVGRFKVCDFRVPQNYNYTMRLKGEIKKGDYQKFLSEIKNYNSLPFNIYIKSPGGDANEAIKIGRLIRKAMIPTFIYEQCNSACFLMWAAGGERLVNGIFDIGLHRPRYEKEYFSNLSSSQAGVEYEKIATKIEQYLREMDVPDHIIEIMMATSSSEIYFIDSIRLKSEIGIETPVMNEWLNARCDVLTSDEMSDLAGVQWYERNPDSDEEIFDTLRKDVENLSDGYVKYLKNKYKKHLECRNSALLSARKEIVKELF